MKSKKIIAVALAFGTLFSSINIAFTSTIKDGKISMPFISNFSSQKTAGTVIGHNNEPDKNILEATESKEISVKLPEKDETVVSGTKESFTVDSKDSDLYSYTQKDIEDLLNKGYSIEDIIKADEVGNRLRENPAKLLEMKEKGKKDWDAIEKGVESERKQNYLSGMQQQKPEMYNRLKNEKFTDDDMALIFAYMNNNEAASLDGIIKEYKARGKEALKADTKKAIDETKLEQYGLKKDDVQGLSDEMLEKLEQVAKDRGVPIKELAAEFKASLKAEGRE